MTLRLENISRKFNRKTGGASFFYAVNPTDLTFSQGSLTAVFGRSGSGKTTLLNMMGGLLEPSSGKVFWDNEDIYSLDDAKLSRLRNERVGMIPQGSSAISSLTVFENVLLPALIYGKREEDAETRAREMLEAVGIPELENAVPGELSGGELRRMAIARAMINRPAVLLADEPTGDLDDENTALVLGLLKKAAEKGAAVVMVTHEPEAAKYADIVLRMDGGTVKE